MSEQKSGQKTDNGFNYRLPSDVTLKHAAKLSIVEDKPIVLDYWTASLDKKALVGAKESGEKLKMFPSLLAWLLMLLKLRMFQEGFSINLT
jgi:hypothetical protein